MEGTVSEPLAPEQIIINGKEYTPEDASSLIELGNKYRETEKTLNTSLDKLMPEYTKASQKAARLEQIEKELAEKNATLEDYQNKAKEKERQAAIPEDRQQALKAAREMGLADQEFLKEQGYVRKADLDEYFNTQYNQKKTQQDLIDNVLKQADGLTKEIDGADGRVPFNQKAVLAYASAYNISDLKQAYEEMNEGANARWKEAQINAQARPGLTTLKPGGKKAPEKTKITDDNFKAAWDELMGSTE